MLTMNRQGRDIMQGKGLIILMAALIGLAGCSTDPHLMNIRAGQDSPDEFAIIPTKELTLPPDLNQLPAPTPGGANITDPTPKADAVAALGGNPARLARTGTPSSDAGLIGYASRGGVEPGIRERLAREDREWRSGRSRRLLEIWARTNVYYRAYRDMTLDPHAELERWRRAGARTPSAPPAVE